MNISLYVYVHIKTIFWKIFFLNRLLVKFLIFLKSRLIFLLLYCFSMFVNKTFHISHVRISQNVKGVLMWNLWPTIFMWRRRYWQRSSSLYSSFCTEVVGLFCITHLDLNRIFGADVNLFVNCLELTMVRV